MALIEFSWDSRYANHVNRGRMGLDMSDDSGIIFFDTDSTNANDFFEMGYVLRRRHQTQL